MSLESMELPPFFKNFTLSQNNNTNHPPNSSELSSESSSEGSIVNSESIPNHGGPQASLSLTRTKGTSLELARCDACVWCRSCWHANKKHERNCIQCGDPLHGDLDPAGPDCFVQGGAFLDLIGSLNGPGLVLPSTSELE